MHDPLTVPIILSHRVRVLISPSRLHRVLARRRLASLVRVPARLAPTRRPVVRVSAPSRPLDRLHRRPPASPRLLRPRAFAIVAFDDRVARRRRVPRAGSPKRHQDEPPRSARSPLPPRRSPTRARSRAPARATDARIRDAHLSRARDARVRRASTRDRDRDDDSRPGSARAVRRAARSRRASRPRDRVLALPTRENERTKVRAKIASASARVDRRGVRRRARATRLSAPDRRAARAAPRASLLAFSARDIRASGTRSHPSIYWFRTRREWGVGAPFFVGSVPIARAIARRTSARG